MGQLRFPKPWYRKSRGCWFVELDGKQYNLGPHKKKAFEEYRRQLIENGRRDPNTSTLLHDLVERYWAWLQVNRKPTTYEPRRRFLDSLKEYFSPKLPAEDIKPADVEAWVRSTFTIKSPSPTSVKDRMALVNTILEWGRRQGLLASNPIAGMEKPRPRKREFYVPPEKFDDVIKAADSPQLRDFIIFMLDTGARTQEMFKLHAENFQFARKKGTASKAVLSLEDSKGNRRRRVIYLPPTSEEIAKRLCKEHPDGPIFCNTRGTPWDRGSINSAFQRMKAATGIKRLCATALRHSYCYHKLTSGYDMATVAKLMGHVDTKMVYDRYGHLDDSEWLGQVATEHTITPPPIEEKEDDDQATDAT